MNSHFEQSNLEIATFGAGCFWCVEAVFQSLEGVLTVTSGYMGGNSPNPTYREVCEGRSGHAEVVQIKFNPKQIAYDTLLSWLWRSHNPTTLNQQGADHGTQYRSVIFYHSESQKMVAEKSMAAAQDHFDLPIVTEITPATTFYPAEDYHQNYYHQNQNAPYCQAVIAPKLDKLNII